MPDITRSTVAFPSGKINLDKVYGIPEPLPYDPEIRKAQITQAFESMLADMQLIGAEVRSVLWAAVAEEMQKLDAQMAPIETAMPQGRYIDAEDEARYLGLVSAKNKLNALRNTLENPARPLNFPALIGTLRYLNDSMDNKPEKIMAALLDREIHILSALAIENLDNFGELPRESSEFSDALDKAVSIPYRRLNTYRDTIREICASNTDLADWLLRMNINSDRPEAEDFLKTLHFAVEQGAISDKSDLIFKANKNFAGDLVSQVGDIQAFEHEEQQYKTLFLRTLSRMLAERGYDVSAEQLFHSQPSLGELPVVGGSQSLLLLKDFSEAKIARRLGFISDSESTTRYQGEFNAVSPEIFPGSKIYAPYFALDAAAVHLLYNHGMKRAALEEWCKDFLNMAALAEHDYFHQLTIPHFDSSRINFLDSDGEVYTHAKRLLGEEGMPKPHTGLIHLEDHALAMHAQIVGRLFEELPKRKECVLGYAVQTYGHLHEIQQQALAHCTSDEARAGVNEAITYLAEIYSHRLFRVISPTDPDLHKPVGVPALSVAAAMDGLQLITPDRLLDPARGSLPSNGLERLERNCSDWLGDTYRAIHTLDSFPVVEMPTSKTERGAQRRHYTDYTTPPAGMQITQIDGLGMVACAMEGAVKNSSDPESYREEGKWRARMMREAQALRADEGAGFEASRIESALRHGKTLAALGVSDTGAQGKEMAIAGGKTEGPGNFRA